MKSGWRRSSKAAGSRLPPNLLDELQRDRRWCQGNLQNARLLAEPGWRPAHRTMLAVGALSYLMAPLWLLFVALGVAAGVVGEHGGALWGLTLLLLLTPRAVGVASVWLKGEHADYGGRWRLVGSALLELLISALQAPVRMLAHTVFVVGTLTGLRLEWKSPPRDASAVGWGDALRRIGMLAAPVGLLAAFALPSSALSAPHLAPLLAALLLAVPLAVLSSQPSVGAALRRLRVLWVPEECRPPLTLRHAIEQRGFADLVPLPIATPPRVFAPARSWHSPRLQRVGMALGSVAVALFVIVTPRYAATPELPVSLQKAAGLVAAMPTVQLPSLMLAGESAPKPVRAVRGEPTRPARMIDDAVRQRAREALLRMTSVEEALDPA